MRGAAERNVFARRHENARPARHINSVHRERTFRRKKNSAASRSGNVKLAVKRDLAKVKEPALDVSSGRRRGKRVVDCLKRLLDMEFARLPIRAHAVPVVEPERRVRTLLHLVDERAVANRVNEPAGDEERIALLRLVADEQFLEAPGLDGIFDILRPDAGL